MNFKLALKQLLGLEQRTIVNNKTINTEARILEFLGPSGVGKSTLYNLVKAKISNTWSDVEFLNQVNFKLVSNEVTDLHWTILKNKMFDVDALVTKSVTKLQLLNYFNKILYDNIKIIQVKSIDRVILEEGICHNFYKEINLLDNKSFLLLVKNRSFICVLPREIATVVKQLKKRTKETGQTVFHHHGLADEELALLTKETVKDINLFINRVEAFNIPICKLFIEDGIDVNCKKIIKFENKILLKD